MRHRQSDVGAEVEYAAHALEGDRREVIAVEECLGKYGRIARPRPECHTEAKAVRADIGFDRLAAELEPSANEADERSKIGREAHVVA
jgi:hypothetical protein